VDHSCRTFEIAAAATQQPKTKKNKKQNKTVYKICNPTMNVFDDQLIIQCFSSNN
jgi:hypothetical protein